MEIVPFIPNWKKNLGKDFSVHGKTKDGAEKTAEPKKKTVIENAIKTADQVAPAVEEVIKKKRGRKKGSHNKPKVNSSDKA